MKFDLASGAKAERKSVQINYYSISALERHGERRETAQANAKRNECMQSCKHTASKNKLSDTSATLTMNGTCMKISAI